MKKLCLSVSKKFKKNDYVTDYVSVDYRNNAGGLMAFRELRLPNRADY